MSKLTSEQEISEQLLAEKVASLPDEMEPQRDLWLGIERAIQSKPQEGLDNNQPDKKVVHFAPYAWAASVVVAVLVTWLSFKSPMQSDKPLTANNQITEQPSKSTEPLVSEKLVTVLSDNFSEQKQSMLVSYGQPDLKQLPVKMQEQLLQLSQARLAIKKALKDDENNVDLLNLLRFTQQQELNLLQQLLPYSTDNTVKLQTI